jgi:predicted patatin/cPLA2 family phospholipase
MEEPFYTQSKLFVKEAIDRGIKEELVVKVLVQHGWSPQAARTLYSICKEEARMEEERAWKREERLKKLLRIKRKIEERRKKYEETKKFWKRLEEISGKFEILG